MKNPHLTYVPLEEALRRGMEPQGRELHELLSRALRDRGMDVPDFIRGDISTRRYIQILHPTDGHQTRLELAFFDWDPVFTMDRSPCVELDIRTGVDIDERDWVTLTVNGYEHPYPDQRKVTGPVRRNRHPLYETFLRSFPELVPRPNDPTIVFRDHSRVQVYANWMIEHFFNQM